MNHRSIFRSSRFRPLSYLTGCGLIRQFMLICTIVTLVGCSNQPQPPNPETPPSSPSPLTSTPSSELPSPAATGTGPVPSPSSSKDSAASRTLEHQLQDSVAKSIGVAVSSVNCPAQADLGPGSRLDCQVMADNQEFTIAVTLQADSGQFQWSSKNLLVLSQLERFIQNRLREKSGIEVTADCGGEIRVAKPGDTFDCQVSDAQGQSRSVQVVVQDERGSVDIKLL